MAERPSVKIIYSDHYRIVPVGGAIGGPSPKADSIVVNFFLEYVTIPEEYELIPVEGREGQFTDPPFPLKTIVREFQFGAVMSPQQAITIGQWLMRHGTDLLKMGVAPNA
ncbi:MAG: hypothetical protein IIA14_00540 [SAR324 cluster bacterium]|nr:hypothetical protein [SAR324 cluster bacterium]